MKALFIGGTGVISTAISQLVTERGWDLTLLNRGNRAGEVQRDIRLFAGKTAQYIFISSASAYQKPLSHPVIR